MEREGVIKFKLDHQPAAPAWDYASAMLAPWRRRLFEAKILGQDPARYGGLGFGNVSVREDAFDPQKGGPFIVSGTQTSGLIDVNASHYARVLGCDPAKNHLASEGPVKPSSEAMTHGMIYSLRASIRFIFHVHSPDIWKKAAPLALAATDPSAAYGTPEMTREVRRLFAERLMGPHGVFVMLGHEDGVVSFGRTPDEAGKPLLSLLESARKL